jgi:hypothetical protein
MLHPLRKGAGPLRPSPDVRASVEQEGVAFLQIRSGSVFRSNRIGATIWQGLVDREEPAMIAGRISAEYGVPVERVRPDVNEFVTRLEKNGFLVHDTGLGADLR